MSGVPENDFGRALERPTRSQDTSMTRYEPNALKRHGRTRNYDHPRRVDKASFYINNSGYEISQARFGGTSDSVAIHQLVAVARGDDPYEVFKDEIHIHHRNGVPWDNRPTNLEILSASEHHARHDNGRWGDAPWRDEDTLHEMFVERRMEHPEIADELGCSLRSVWVWINRLGVEREEGAFPCGHDGIRNLGSGEYSCSQDGCEARYTREQVEEVYGK